MQRESQDGARLRILGEWWDEWYEPDSEGKPGRLVKKTPVRKNLQMDMSLVLVAALLKGEVGYSGLVYHVQGHGDAGWGASPPTPSVSNVALFDEFDRRAPDTIIYLDGSDLPVAGPTAKLRISTTYGVSDLAGETIREQALFGGNATATADSGQILNIIRHEEIFKSGALILTRRIKLTLTT